ncbi:hypothetical protein ABT104_04405 [Streptomyces mobaraensis]|uniref:hypothetical protein n=1 Tax=Streptomyces mobaraensis TaxID=35621 RepID=UPI0033228EE2
MAETWTEERLTADGFERVLCEWEWNDGPRTGLADVQGKPHYFERHDDDRAGEADEYRVWPASEDAVKLEREQWAIFAGWNERHEAGEVSPETHPGHGGIDARYDELELLLAPHRRPPNDARRLAGELRFDTGTRYRAEGLDYWFRWRPSREAAADHQVPSGASCHRSSGT